MAIISQIPELLLTWIRPRSTASQHCQHQALARSCSEHLHSSQCSSVIKLLQNQAKLVNLKITNNWKDKYSVMQHWRFSDHTNCTVTYQSTHFLSTAIPNWRSFYPRPLLSDQHRQEQQAHFVLTCTKTILTFPATNGTAVHDPNALFRDHKQNSSYSNGTRIPNDIF